MKVYLAGPDVFHPKALQLGKSKKQICSEHGLVGLFPLDNALDLDALPPYEQGLAIFQANIVLMDQCDVIAANMTPFRGPSLDAGTAFEIGYVYAQHKPVYAYTNTTTSFTDRSQGLDPYDVEAFDMVDNLMLEGAISKSGGKLITHAADDPFLDLTAFRQCIEAISQL